MIGNGGGGKTTLSRRLAQRYGVPLIHVDSIQFLPDFHVRPPEDTARMLDEIAGQPQWLIDGFGSLAVMQRRFALADQIVFVDFPLWRHYWWCTKRQITSLRKPRSELLAGCRDATLAHTLKLYKILLKIHRQIRPQLLAIFTQPEIRGKVTIVRNPRDWKNLFELGFTP